MNMNAMQKRFLLFLGGCIPARLFLVFLAKKTPLPFLPYLGYLALLPAFGFLYLFFTGKRQTGLETQGAPIWWAHFRLLHGLNYLLFFFLAVQRIARAYQILLFDVVLGLILFLIHHFNAGDFERIF
jgi:hypothetical protein